MTPERWRKVKSVLAEALEQPAPARQAWLHTTCGADEELRTEVESLLGASDDAGDFLESAALEPGAGTKIGHYRIVREIDRGGMGAVYLAVRDDEFEQEVAIKVVKRGMDTDAVLRRFRYERQILAFLNHQNIAKLLDGGATNDGRPYIVMEYIQGRPIGEYCHEHGLSVEDRVRLFRQVCEAVEYAHRNLIIHRDLKPANILITPQGQPKLLDFGIAKIFVPDRPELTLSVTSSGRMLTPDYASPEQVRGEPMTTATDVYSLGAVLYELLTGMKAQRFDTLSPAEIEKVVCTQDPPKAGLGDLDHILSKAMEKEVSRRYLSVEQFSADLGRWLDGRPIKAREATLWYRTSKFVRRHRGGVATAALVTLSLLAGLATTAWQASIARQERDRAQRRFNDVRRLANSFLVEHDVLAAVAGGTAVRSQLLKDALEYLDTLAEEAQDDPGLQRELASAYEKMGDVQGRADGPNLGDAGAALESYRKAVAIRERLASNKGRAEDERSLAGAYAGLGGALRLAGDFRGALEYDRKALDIRQSLFAVDPLNREYRRLVASSYTTLGLSLYQTGDLDGALEFRKKALAAYQELVVNGPATAEDHRGLALANIRMGSILVRKNEVDAGLGHYHQALSATETGLRVNPQNAMLRSTSATAHSAMGSAYLGRREIDKALAEYRSANGIYASLSAADPNDARLVSLLSETHFRMGRALLTQRSPEQALAQFRTSLQLRESIFQRSPMNAGARGEVAESLGGLGDAYAAAGRWREALEHYQKAVALYEDMKQKGQLNAVTTQEFERVRKEINRRSRQG